MVCAFVNGLSIKTSNDSARRHLDPGLKTWRASQALGLRKEELTMEDIMCSWHHLAMESMWIDSGHAASWALLYFLGRLPGQWWWMACDGTVGLRICVPLIWLLLRLQKIS